MAGAGELGHEVVLGGDQRRRRAGRAALRGHGVSLLAGVGLAAFVLYDARWAPVISALDFVAALAAGRALGKERLPRACLLLFLVILFFAPGLGSQYLIWPITFGALFGGSRYFLFSAASIAWTVGSHYGIPGSGRWMGHLIWLACGFWAIGELRFLQRPGKLARFS
jgi:hypothetical protein